MQMRLDILKLVSSDDIGKDESNVQTLLKKQKEVIDDLRNYQPTIGSLHEQASALGEKGRKSGPVVKRLYEMAKIRKQRLLDALSLYKVLTKDDGMEQWIEIVAKQNQLNSKWSSFRDNSEMKREELNPAHGAQAFHIKCCEFAPWIEEMQNK